MRTREEIINAARTKDPDIGDESMIATGEWGYWIGSIYVSKKEVDSLANNQTHPTADE